MELENNSFNTDWKITYGSFQNIISLKFCQSDTVIERPDVDAIIGLERATLLEGEDSVCPIKIKAIPGHVIQSFTLITECPKLELLLGSQQEYINTYYGDLLDNIQDTQVYRFDVLLSQPSIQEIVLKLIPGAGQFGIYGMMVFVKKDSNTNMFSPKINLENVQKILSNSNFKLSPSAEKCKDFLQMYMSKNNNTSPLDIGATMAGINADFAQRFSLKEEPLQQDTSKSCSAECISELKQHIDCRFLEIEKSLNDRLNEIEQTQNEKFDEMVGKLEECIQQRIENIEKNQNTKLDKILKILEN